MSKKNLDKLDAFMDGDDTAIEDGNELLDILTEWVEEGL